MTIAIYYVGIKDKEKNMINKFRFKDMLFDYWDTLNWRILDLTKKAGSGQDVSSYQYNIMQFVNKFGDLIRPIYGSDNRDLINIGMNGLMAGLFQAIALLENGTEPEELSTRIVDGPISQLDAILSSLNPDWGGGVVTQVFTSLWNNWLDEVRGQLANDVVKANDAFKESKSTTNSFVEVFFNGVVSQFPNFFTDRSM